MCVVYACDNVIWMWEWPYWIWVLIKERIYIFVFMLLIENGMVTSLWGFWHTISLMRKSNIYVLKISVILIAGIVYWIELADGPHVGHMNFAIRDSLSIKCPMIVNYHEKWCEFVATHKEMIIYSGLQFSMTHATVLHGIYENEWLHFEHKVGCWYWTIKNTTKYSTMITMNSSIPTWHAEWPQWFHSICRTSETCNRWEASCS